MSEERTKANERRAVMLRQRAKRDEITRRTVVTALMNSVEGRRYVWVELNHARVFSQTFSAAPGGYAITAFNEGVRSVGLRLLADVTRWCAKSYMQMTIENSAVELEETQDAGSSDSNDDD